MIPPTARDDPDEAPRDEHPAEARDAASETATRQVEPGEPEESEESTAEVTVVDWNRLPGPLRARLAELAAAALSEMRPGDVPMRLRPVVRFAPAKRAKLGQTELLAGLRDSSVFRAAVLDWCRNHRPTALRLDASDALAVAAAAVLQDSPTAIHHVELIDHRSAIATLRGERDTAVARAEKLATDNERLRAELAETGRIAQQAQEQSGSDADRLRKRLRDQGMKLKEAKDDAAAARSESERVREEAERSVSEMAAERDRERSRAAEERARADRAGREVETARQAAREARQGDELRLALLLDTLEGSVAGLRREIGADQMGADMTAGPRPAETISGVRTHSATTGEVADLAGLDRLLALPAVHLIVDGYNVTKTGYPELTLADQRDRLAHQLAALAARASVEVTLVFDGADVVAVPHAGPRGVRVLFSDPGVQADDVIRDLVEAEPRGRQIVVATSDRAVVSSVRRRGAYAVSSAVLLERINRSS